VCQEEAYLLELVRYIHLNPLRAGLVKGVADLNRFPWSGHSVLMGKVRREWQNTEYVLSLFGGGHARKRNYLAYVEEGIGLGSQPHLVGGGLIRSLGGWSEVIAMRSRGKEPTSDCRILGDQDFVQRLLATREESLSKDVRRSAIQRTGEMDGLTSEVCSRYDVSLGELRSGSRRKEVLKARRLISWVAIRELGYSGAEVARHLGVTSSCINRFISVGTNPDPDFRLKDL